MVPSETSLVTIVVRELSIRQVVIPTRTIIQRTSSQHILQDLIDSLGVPICLRMERCTELQPSAQGLMQLTPTLRSKLSTSVRNNLAWNSMQTHDPGHINLG